MSVYDNEATALTDLTKNKKPDCVEALERLFWQARGEAFGIREAWKFAEFTHFIQAHDGLNHGETLSVDENTTLTTDEEVKKFIADSIPQATEMGDDEDEVKRFAGKFIYWYDLYRSWGGDVFLSYEGAVQNVDEIASEENDLDLTETRKQVEEKFPIDELKDEAIKTFDDAIAAGYTVRQAYDQTKQLVLGGLGSLFASLASAGIAVPNKNSLLN